jgi:diguanylate cyclase (GGDEF)-like protein
MGLSKRTRIAVYLNWPESDPYQKEFLLGVHRVALERDLDILAFGIGNLGPDPAADYPGIMFLDFMETSIPDGVIFLTGSFGQGAGPERKRSLVRQGLPMVSVGDVIEEIPAVLLDNAAGFETLLDHLFGHHGYRNPVFVAGPEGSWDSNERLGCFKRALTRHGLAWDPSMVFHGTFTIDSGEHAATHFLEIQGRRPDVLVCANDNMAIGVRQALARHADPSLRELPVTGFDNIPISDWLESPLSTVKQPFDKSGRMAVEMVLDLIAGKPVVPATRYLPTEAMVRSSCGCPGQGAGISPAGGSGAGAGCREIIAELQSAMLEALVKEDRDRLDQGQLSVFFRDYLTDHRLGGHLRSEVEMMSRLQIGTMFVALFEEAGSGAGGNSVLQLAWEDHQRLELPEQGLSFPTRSLLPPDLYPKKRSTLLVTILEEATQCFGYLVMEYGISALRLDLFRNHLTESLMAVTIAEKLQKLNDDLLAAQAKLETLSQTDELTGHYNRRGFMALARRSMAYCQRQGESFLILFMDLDGLKFINDTWGHDEGDRAITGLAEILRISFRGTDIVCRLGGDEFTVFAANAGPASLNTILARIDTQIQETNLALAKPWKLGVSVGAFHAASDCRLSLEEMMMEADKALYQEKRRKKGLPPV